MNIRTEIADDDWVIATDGIAQFMRPSLDGSVSAGRCQELWLFGPAGTVWFDSGSRTVGYSGSVLYLSCHMNNWLRQLPDSQTIHSESVFQSPELVVTRSGGHVQLRFDRGGRYDQVVAPLDDCREAVRSFVAKFTSDALARWHDIVDPDFAFRWE